MMPRTAAATLALLLVPATAFAAPGTPGVTWEQTVEMQMDDMAMPPQTSTTCAPASGPQEPPRSPGDAGNCRTVDLKRTGGRMTWKMVCADGGRGTGEMTLAGDSYTGRMAFTSDEGAMTMKLRGRKVGGACVMGQPLAAGGQQQQMMEMMQRQQQQGLQMQQMQQQMMARELATQCQEAVTEMNLTLFTMEGAYGCKDPKQVKAFCDRLGTRDGFSRLQGKGQGQGAVDQAAAFCKQDPARLRARLCAEAERAEDLDLLGRSCPKETRALAQRECAGKESSNLPSTYQSFCLTYARDLLAAPTPRNDVKEKAVDEGKKLLKGLFGR
jgi:hypothetical protein